MTISLRQARTDDIDQLIPLFRNVYRYNPRLTEPDYLDWQFRGGAFAQHHDYHLWLAEQEGQIVAFLGYVPVEFYHHGQLLKGCWPQNWAAPGQKLAGFAVLSKLMESFDNLFYVGLTNDTMNIFQRLQVPMQRCMPRWLSILDATKTASLFGISRQQDMEIIGRSSLKCRNQPAGPDISCCTRFADDADFRFDHIPAVKSYSRRTGPYLNWRYFDIPRHNYRGLYAKNGQFAVYRIETITGHEAAALRILEWSFAGNLAAAAMGWLLQDAHRQGVIMMDFFCTAPAVGRELENLGFFSQSELKTPIPYLFRPVCQADGISVAVDLPPHRQPRNLDFSTWYITKGDSDIDRIKC